MMIPMAYITIILLILLLSLPRISIGSPDKQTPWKAELLNRITMANSSYLCFYIRAKLSYQKKQKEGRNAQLNRILHECGLANVTMSDAYKSTLSDAISNLNTTANAKSHILIYTHNGFGNQLYQIAFGYLLAKSMGREFHVIDKMPNFMYNPHHPDKLDPNSWSAYLAGREVLGFSRVNQTWIIDTCKGSNLTYSERRADKKSKNSQSIMLMEMPAWNYILKVSPRCIILLGYWMNPQWFSSFLPEVKSAFKNALQKLERYKLDHNDIVIHLRCAQPHYLMLPSSYYDNILQNISYGNIWLAASPSCKDYSEVKSLVIKYGMRYYAHPDIKKRPKDTAFLSDFALLLSASRLILGPSTFSDWGGLLGAAHEIHVPYFTKQIHGPPSRNWAPVWYSDKRYIYHDPFDHRYFGKYDSVLDRVLFANDSLLRESYVGSNLNSVTLS